VIVIAPSCREAVNVVECSDFVKRTRISEPAASCMDTVQPAAAATFVTSRVSWPSKVKATVPAGPTDHEYEPATPAMEPFPEPLFVGVGVGVEVGVAVAVAVAVPVGVAIAVDVPVAVGDGVGVDVDVNDGVGDGVAAARSDS
jgi:hypothetical protein